MLIPRPLAVRPEELRSDPACKKTFSSIGSPSGKALWGSGKEGIVLAVGAFVAATLAAVAGFGGAAVLLPILVAIFGVRDAIPILTVAQLIGNSSRVWFNYRDLDFRVVGWFSVGAVPMALVGGALFAAAPLHALTRLLGVFLILIVLRRRLRRGQLWRPSLKSFTLIGGGFSFLSALLGSVGPLMAPFFLAYGLVKGAYIGTEALATVIMHVTKLVAYRQLAILSLQAVYVGVALGPIMVAGSFAGKRVMDRLPASVFVVIIEVVMLIAGFLFIVRG